MTSYSSWTSLNSLPRKGQTEVIHRYVFTSLLHPLWGKGSTFLAPSFTKVCWQNVLVSNTAAVRESKKSQQIHKGSDPFLKPTLFGQLILHFYQWEKPTRFSKSVSWMKQRAAAEESQLESSLEKKCYVLRACSVLLTAWALDKNKITFNSQHFIDTTKQS